MNSDKAAKSLLGESFKRQLKYDGIYSRVTFICSKTDDISITEACSSLSLEEQVTADWARIDEIDDQLRALKKTMQELKDSRSVYSELVNEADDEIEKWEKLKDDLEDGMEVWPPYDKIKKRKRSLTSNKSPKKTKKSKSDGHSSAEETNSEDEPDSDASEAESGPESEKGDPLTLEAVEDKLSQFKDDKRRARKERSALDAKTKSLNEEIQALQKDKDTIESDISAICIKGRNDYSKGAIQTDFAAGVKELDQENAQEDDEANFNPEEDIRNYEEVARSLPVRMKSHRH
jgi:chromosome segregation ATPase